MQGERTVSSGETSDLASNHFFDDALADHCTGEVGIAEAPSPSPTPSSPFKPPSLLRRLGMEERRPSEERSRPTSGCSMRSIERTEKRSSEEASRFLGKHRLDPGLPLGAKVESGPAEGPPRPGEILSDRVGDVKYLAGTGSLGPVWLTMFTGV